MAEWNRGDAEMAIALKRVELNRALAHKSAYNAEGHNLCLALIRFQDGSIDVLAAYSNDVAVPPSIRLGLNLAPNLYGAMAPAQRFGCDGMAQYHTEPKLLNYLCATPAIRQSALSGSLPRHALYRSVLRKQREQAARSAQLLRSPESVASVTLVTEIDCCPTCTKYSVDRFRTRFPHIELQVVELGKKVSENVSPRFSEVKVTTRR